MSDEHYQTWRRNLSGPEDVSECAECEEPWPCLPGRLAKIEKAAAVTMADLRSRIAAAEARAEQAERERDASVKARMDWQADYDREKRQHHARLDALRERLAVAEELADQRMRHRTEQLRGNARLRERLATVEAAADPIIRYLLAVIESADCQGYVPPGYERSDILQAVNDVLLRQSDIELFRAALAATPADDPIPPMQPRVTYSATVRVGEVRRAAPHVYDDEIAYEDMAATPATDEPAELSMIRAGDELVREIDAALDGDGFDSTAPRVRFENVAEVIEWLTSDDDAAPPAAGEVAG